MRCAGHGIFFQGESPVPGIYRQVQRNASCCQQWREGGSGAAEIDEQDTHQIIVIGIAAVVLHNAMADSLMDEISVFVEENTEAEILDELWEIR